MKTLIALLLLAQTAAIPPAGGGVFEVHAESSPKAANARAWVLTGPGRSAETVYLDGAVLLDKTTIATADVVRGPDGSPQIRLVLTTDGAQRLAEIASRGAGKRLGIVAGGRLRAAPYLSGGPPNGVLVIAGALTDAEATELAPKLGPPSPAAVEAARPPVRGDTIPELQGRWKIEDATMNGKIVPDAKLTSMSWFFRGGDLLLTDVQGKTVRFAVRSEGPGVLRLEPAGGSGERGGWLLWMRQRDDLVLAFQDNLEGRPDGFGPGPKKIIARLRAPGPR